jgi:hypothetical protein
MDICATQSQYSCKKNCGNIVSNISSGWESSKVPMSILDKLIEKMEGKEHPILMFVEDELRDLIFHQEK